MNITVAECTIIKLEGFEILEMPRNGIYEYYVKAYEKVNYIYVFGTADRFTKLQLKTLAENEYFDSILEDA